MQVSAFSRTGYELTLEVPSSADDDDGKADRGDSSTTHDLRNYYTSWFNHVFKNNLNYIYYGWKRATYPFSGSFCFFSGYPSLQRIITLIWRPPASVPTTRLLLL